MNHDRLKRKKLNGLERIHQDFWALTQSLYPQRDPKDDHDADFCCVR